MKNKRLSIAMLLILFTGMAFAQKDIEIDYKAFSQLPDISKDQVKKLKAADRVYYSEYESHYKNSLPLYLDVYRENLGYDPLDWRIAMCYLHSEDKTKAINYILRCDESVSKLYYFFLGKAYHFAGEFEKAIENYGFFADHLLEEDQKMFYSTFKVKNKNYVFAEVMQELIHACNIGIDNSNDSIAISFENIKIINTKNDELYPFLHPDGILIYTSNKPLVPNQLESTYKIFGAVCDSLLIIGFPKLSDKYPQDVDDNLLALPFYENSERLLYQSMKTKGGNLMLTYAKGEKIKGKTIPNINSSSKEGTACLLSDSTLVFSSDRASKVGKSDLYIAFKNTAGKWSKPVCVGGNINTTSNEEVVTYYNDELYYVSNAKGGIGGYDIYKAPYLGNNNWGETENLGYPINTADNDMGYFPVDDYSGFYCGVRPGGVGGIDIYKVTYDSLSSVNARVVDSIIVDSVNLDLMYMDTTVVDSLLLDSMTVDSVLLVVEKDSITVIDSTIIEPLHSPILDVRLEGEKFNNVEESSDSSLLIEQ